MGALRQALATTTSAAASGGQKTSATATKTTPTKSVSVVDGTKKSYDSSALRQALSNSTGVTATSQKLNADGTAYTGTTKTATPTTSKDTSAYWTSGISTPTTKTTTGTSDNSAYAQALKDSLAAPATIYTGLSENNRTNQATTPDTTTTPTQQLAAKSVALRAARKASGTDKDDSAYWQSRTPTTPTTSAKKVTVDLGNNPYQKPTSFYADVSNMDLSGTKDPTVWGEYSDKTWGDILNAGNGLTVGGNASYITPDGKAINIDRNGNINGGGQIDVSGYKTAAENSDSISHFGKALIRGLTAGVSALPIGNTYTNLIQNIANTSRGGTGLVLNGLKFDYTDVPSAGYKDTSNPYYDPYTGYANYLPEDSNGLKTDQPIMNSAMDWNNGRWGGKVVNGKWVADEQQLSPSEYAALPENSADKTNYADYGNYTMDWKDGKLATMGKDMDAKTVQLIYDQLSHNNADQLLEDGYGQAGSAKSGKINFAEATNAINDWLKNAAADGAVKNFDDSDYAGVIDPKSGNNIYQRDQTYDQALNKAGGAEGRLFNTWDDFLTWQNENGYSNGNAYAVNSANDQVGSDTYTANLVNALNGNLGKAAEQEAAEALAALQSTSPDAYNNLLQMSQQMDISGTGDKTNSDAYKKWNMGELGWGKGTAVVDPNTGEVYKDANGNAYTSTVFNNALTSVLSGDTDIDSLPTELGNALETYYENLTDEEREALNPVTEDNNGGGGGGGSRGGGGGGSGGGGGGSTNNADFLYSMPEVANQIANSAKNSLLPSGYTYDYNARNASRIADIQNAENSYKQSTIPTIANTYQDQSANTLAQLAQTLKSNRASGLTSGANRGAQLASDVQAVQSAQTSNNESLSNLINTNLASYLQTLAGKRATAGSDTASELNAYYSPMMSALSNVLGYYNYGSAAAQVNNGGLQRQLSYLV